MKPSRLLVTAALCLLLPIQATICQRDETLSVASKKLINEPTIFAPGMISTGDYEVCPQFSPDGETFYFVKSTPDANFWTIVVSRLENGKWTDPQVTPFSGRYSDADEFITSDGKQMFFISRRQL